MLAENIAYALVQVMHNFGAVIVSGGAAFALWTPGTMELRETRLARLVGMGWAVQIASGAGFGGVSYYHYGQFPDLHGVAVAALAIKITCAVCGLALASSLALRATRWHSHRRRVVWHVLAALAVLALTAAAFLRWFA